MLSRPSADEMEPSRPQEEELSGRVSVLVDLARRSLGEMSERQRLAGLQGLRTRLHDRYRARRKLWTGLAVTGVTAGVLFLGVAARRHDPRAPLTLRVESAKLSREGFVEGVGSVRPIIRFSDGSQVSLADGARVHVRALNGQGARVALDDGRVHVYVVHGPDTHWAFEAGPFVITATGTAFSLSWSESTRCLDVGLESGAVTVIGPPSDAPSRCAPGND
jgi:ferric-dicitrate binding protein FerR (iron transport regulator)